MVASYKTEQHLLVGVDVGGSKVAVLVVDSRGRVCGRWTESTLLHSPADTLAGITRSIRQAVQDAGASLSQVAAVGLGIPGRVDPATGVVRQAVNLHWDELPAGALLAEALGVPCVLENDVRLATLGLQRHPDYSAVSNLAYVSVGTGIAAGLILGGQLYRGTYGMAGEIGHSIMDPNGPPCACGLPGCLEALAAGPAIAAQAALLAGDTPSHLRQEGGPDGITAATVYAAAGEGDALALGVVQAVSRVLAQALQQLVMAYDVEQVVLGGGVARAGASFLAPILAHLAHLRGQSALAAMMLPPERFTLVPDGYEAGLWGGVALAQAASAATPPATARGVDGTRGGEQPLSIYTR